MILIEGLPVSLNISGCLITIFNIITKFIMTKSNYYDTTQCAV